MTIDTSVLDAYRDFMEEEAEEFIQDILSEFYANARELLKKLEMLPKAEDMREFLRAAHTLKSTSATVGATHLSELAAKIEELGKNDNLDDVPALLAQLPDVYKNAENQLKEIYS